MSREDSNDKGGSLPEPTGDAPRVLIVEDDEVLIGILEHHLRQHGCRVFVALNADRALEILSNTPIDVTGPWWPR